MTTPAGWYDDGSGRLRWWDGSQWTEHVAPVTPASAEPEPFAPPYAMQSQTSQDAAPGYDPTSTGYPVAAAYAPAAGPAPARKLSVLGLVGLGTAVIGAVLACIPPIAWVGWIVLGLAFVVSLISLFLRGTKWPGITGMGVAAFGTILAVSVSLFTLAIDSPVEAGDSPSVSPSGRPPAEDDTPADDEEPSPENVEMVYVADLEVGDCLPLIEASEEVGEVPVVPCEDPHTDEVYLVSELPEGDFPGDDEIAAQADALCLGAFEEFVGKSYETSELDFAWYVPTKSSWIRWGDRTVQCIVFSYEDVTGTLKGAGY